MPYRFGLVPEQPCNFQAFFNFLFFGLRKCFGGYLELVRKVFEGSCSIFCRAGLVARELAGSLVAHRLTEELCGPLHSFLLLGRGPTVLKRGQRECQLG